MVATVAAPSSSLTDDRIRTRLERAASHQADARRRRGTRTLRTRLCLGRFGGRGRPGQIRSATMKAAVVKTTNTLGSIWSRSSFKSGMTERRTRSQLVAIFSSRNEPFANSGIVEKRLCG